MKAIADTVVKSTLFLTLFFAILVAVSGCAAVDQYGQIAISKGAEANDTALEASEAIICRAASVGSIMRKYGQEPSKAAAWRELCVESNKAAPEIVK